MPFGWRMSGISDSNLERLPYLPKSSALSRIAGERSGAINSGSTSGVRTSITISLMPKPVSPLSACRPTGPTLRKRSTRLSRAQVISGGPPQPPLKMPLLRSRNPILRIWQYTLSTFLVRMGIESQVGHNVCSSAMMTSKTYECLVGRIRIASSVSVNNWRLTRSSEVVSVCLGCSMYNTFFP